MEFVLSGSPVWVERLTPKCVFRAHCLCNPNNRQSLPSSTTDPIKIRQPAQFVWIPPGPPRETTRQESVGWDKRSAGPPKNFRRVRGCPEKGTGTLHLVQGRGPTHNLWEPVPFSGQPLRLPAAMAARVLDKRSGPGNLGRRQSQDEPSCQSPGSPQTGPDELTLPTGPFPHYQEGRTAS